MGESDRRRLKMNAETGVIEKLKPYWKKSALRIPISYYLEAEQGRILKKKVIGIL